MVIQGMRKYLLKMECERNVIRTECYWGKEIIVTLIGDEEVGRQ